MSAPDPNAETRRDGPPQGPSDAAETLRVGPAGPDSATVASAQGGPAPLPPGGRPFGRYRLLAELGRGAMGVVWRAHDTRLDRDVALKQVRAGELADAAQVERFEREARLAARLAHPGIVPVHDVGVEEGTHYFTSDYVPSRSLEAVLRSPVTLEQALSWARGIAEALDYAHRQGVVHRDVKPANILIDEAGRPHLTDFGLAKEVSLESESSLTASGTLLGTPAYMSPEQATGRIEEIGPASDQFSLGVILYEMVCRARPFAGDSLRALLNAIAEREPARPTAIDRRIPADLETVCLKALEKDSRARYASLGEMAADLGRCQAGEPVRARPISPLVRLARRAAKRPGVLALVVIVLALSAWGVVSWRLRARDREEAERQRQAAEEAALRKAERVAQVLLRWSDLRATLAEIERAHFSVTLSDEERRALLDRLRQPVDDFARATPSDPTSQSAMNALVGWVDHLCLRPDACEARLREAARLDPDLPYAALVEAMIRAVPYLAAQAMPDLEFGGNAYDAGAPGAETPEMRALRKEAREWLAKAAAARVWGQGLAQEFRKAIEAMAMTCEGDYAGAERLLTQVIEASRMPAFETELRFARARVRLFLHRPKEALADIEQVRAARPASDQPLRFRGLTLIAQASEKGAQGADATGDLDQAIASADEAVSLLQRGRHTEWLASALTDRACFRFLRAQHGEMSGEDVSAPLRAALADVGAADRINEPNVERLSVAGAACMKIGERMAAMGQDPEDWYAHSAQDFEAAVRMDEGCRSARLMLAMVLAKRADWRTDHGGDPRPDFAAALAGFDAVLSEKPDETQALQYRARLKGSQASNPSRSGVDAREALESGIADLDRAIQLSQQAELFEERAILLAQRGQQEQGRVADPRPWFARSQDDADAAVRCAPTAEAYYRRGMSHLVLGSWLEQVGLDPRAELRAAIADDEKSAVLNPRFRPTWDDLATLYSLVGEFASEAHALQQALQLPGVDDAALKERLVQARQELQVVDDARLPPFTIRVGYAIASFAQKDYGAVWRHLNRARAMTRPEDEGTAVNGRTYADNLYDLACLTTCISEGRLPGAEEKQVQPARAAWLREAAFSDLLAAIDHGFKDAEKVRNDPDLAPLRSDARWKEVEGRLSAIPRSGDGR